MASKITLNNRIIIQNQMEQQAYGQKLQLNFQQQYSHIGNGKLAASSCFVDTYCSNSLGSQQVFVKQLINQQSCAEITKFSCQQQCSISPFVFNHCLKLNQQGVACRNHQKWLQKVSHRINLTQQQQNESELSQKSNIKLMENVGDSHEQTNNDPRVIIEQTQNQQGLKSQQTGNLSSNNNVINKSYNLANMDQINLENLFDYLQNNRFQQRKTPRNVYNRKEIVAFNLKLKDLLLSKYNLLDIPKITVDKPKNVQKQAKKTKKVRADVKNLVIRKLHKILKKRQQNIPYDLRQKSIVKIISDFEQLHGSQSLKYTKSFIKLIRQINDSFDITHAYLQNQLSNQLAYEQKSSSFQPQASSKAEESIVPECAI